MAMTCNRCIQFSQWKLMKRRVYIYIYNIDLIEYSLTYYVRVSISANRVVAVVVVVASPIRYWYYYYCYYHWTYSLMNWLSLALQSMMTRRPGRAIISTFQHQIDVMRSLLMALGRVCCVWIKLTKEHVHWFRVIIINVFNYLESGSHSSCVSSVDNSVSVDVAEWAWFGVDGRLVLSNLRQVHRRSMNFNNNLKSN